MANYTMGYAGGMTAVPMNQTRDGGPLNLLGTLIFQILVCTHWELSYQRYGRVVVAAAIVVSAELGPNRRR